MKNKRIVLKEGFVIAGNEIIPCHLRRITTSDMWSEETQEYLVSVDGVVRIIGRHKNEVFECEKDAEKALSGKLEKHLEFCKTQVCYYQSQLDSFKEKK